MSLSSNHRHRQTRNEPMIDELKDNIKQLNTAIQASRTVVLVFSKERTIVNLNAEAEHLYSVTSEEVIGKNYLELFIPKDQRAEVDTYISKVLDGHDGQPTKNYENDIMAGDGTTCTLQWSFKRVLLSTGEVDAIVAVGVDVTKQKQASEKLHKLKYLNKKLIDSSPAFFVMIDAQGKTVLMSPAMLNALGYSQEEVSGADYLATFVPERDREYLARIFGRIVKSKQTTVNENHVLTKDGQELLVEWHGCPITNPDDSLDVFFGVGIDITARKQTEDDLKLERDKLRALLDGGLAALNIGVDIVTEDREVVYQNKTLLDQFGDLTGKKCYEGYMGRKDSCDPCVMKQALEDNDIHRTELETPNGRFYELISAPFADESSTSKKAIEVVMDITERMAAEEALRDTKNLLSETETLAKIASWEWDHRTNAVVWSDGVYQLLGYEPGEITPSYDAWMNTIFPDDLSSVKGLGQQAVKSNKDVSVEYRIVRRDGTFRHIHTKTQQIFDKEGNVSKVIGYVQDITDRKQAEADLRMSEERLAKFMNSAEDSFYLLDSNLHFVEINTKGLEITGRNKDDVIGRDIRDIVPGIEESGQYASHMEVLRTGKSFVVDDLIAHPMFGDKHFILKSFKVGDGLGVIATDISKQKKTEQELKAAFVEISKLKERIEAENLYLREKIRRVHLQGDMICESAPMREIVTQVEQVANTDATVLILGETGTGKEVLARAIHDESNRYKYPMVIVNCAAMPATLIESELFGREKGAYTGALTKQIGRFELADKSTIFLDEVGELSLELQAKLLRVLQEGKFEPLGSSGTISVDVRVIAATNRDLEQEVADGRFRADLFYRLNVFPFWIPPLRERLDDIQPLTWSFVSELSEKMGKRVDRIEKQSMTALFNYRWPGNIRELRNVVERSMILCNSTTLSVQIPATGPKTEPHTMTLKDRERQHILSVLEMTGWRVRGKQGAAEILGIKPTTLEYRMTKLDIQRPKTDLQ
ncbi:MAG: PAS domain S-box protein [Proteobacteria bacterium]|nr:PAS domain S-box protein [Pseudomonadota bacterium]